MDLPENNADYKEKAYWNDRFSREESFEWFRGYDAFKHLLKSWLKPDDRILVLGCGNSDMSEDMYNDGYRHITNVDFSGVVIARMSEKCAHCPEMKWLTMDITDMAAFRDGSFDVVLEKGTIDALLVDEKDPWNPTGAAIGLMHKILSETSRVLTTNGTFVSITFAQPHFRRPFLAHSGYAWALQEPVATFGEYFHYFAYCISKVGPFDPDVPLVFPFRMPVDAPVIFDDSSDDENFLSEIDGL